MDNNDKLILLLINIIKTLKYNTFKQKYRLQSIKLGFLKVLILINSRGMQYLNIPFKRTQMGQI